MSRSNGESRVARYAGTASALAPVVRRLASDAELRDDLKVVLEAGKKLYDDLSVEEPLTLTRKIFTDANVRQQIDKALLAIEDASAHVRPPRKRSRAWLAGLVVGSIIGGAAALFFAPKTAPTMRRWASSATTGGDSTSSSDFRTPMAA